MPDSPYVSREAFSKLLLTLKTYRRLVEQIVRLYPSTGREAGERTDISFVTSLQDANAVGAYFEMHPSVVMILKGGGS